MSSKVAAVAVLHDPRNEPIRTRTDEQCQTMDRVENTYDKIFLCKTGQAEPSRGIY